MGTTDLGCPHVDSPTRRELYAVKIGSFTHYVPKRRSSGANPAMPNATLCGEGAPFVRGQYRWHFVRTKNHLGRACMTCHARSCSEPSLIVFPFEK